MEKIKISVEGNRWKVGLAFEGERGTDMYFLNLWRAFMGILQFEAMKFGYKPSEAVEAWAEEIGTGGKVVGDDIAVCPNCHQPQLRVNKDRLIECDFCAYKPISVSR